MAVEQSGRVPEVLRLAGGDLELRAHFLERHMADSNELNGSSRTFRVGDVVRFRESKSVGGAVSAAIITAAHSQACVSLYVIPFGRAPYAATSVGIGNSGHYIED